jgi:AcrR family transcriptional regulator
MNKNQIPLENPYSGRPRSAEATKLVQKAALKLAFEGGIGNATIEKIALRSGVAKTTIYRRWSSAHAVVMDAFLADIGPAIEYIDQPSVVDTFKHTVGLFIAALRGRRGKLLKHLIGSSQENDELRRAFWTHWIEPRRKLGLAVLARALERGELRKGCSLDALMDALFGAIYYRLVISHAPLDVQYVHLHIEQVFAGVLSRSEY